MAWTASLLRAKSRVLGIHGAISALVVCPFLYLAWFHWFPPPLFFTDGGWQGMRIMLVVHILIGPALSFLVFDPAKTRLALAADFGFIGLVQAAALIYGCVAIEGKRPLVIAFHDGRFVAVTKDRFSTQTIEASEWRRLGERPPYRVAVRAPATPQEHAGVTTFGLLEGQTAEELFFLYQPLAERWPTMEGQAMPAGDLARFDPDLRQPLHELLARHRQVRLFLLAGHYRDAWLAFDTGGRYLDALYVSRKPAATTAPARGPPPG